MKFESIQIDGGKQHYFFKDNVTVSLTGLEFTRILLLIILTIIVIITFIIDLDF
jgi:hypothetical protein